MTMTTPKSLNLYLYEHKLVMKGRYGRFKNFPFIDFHKIRHLEHWCDNCGAVDQYAVECEQGCHFEAGRWRMDFTQNAIRPIPGEILRKNGNPVGPDLALL